MALTQKGLLVSACRKRNRSAPLCRAQSAARPRADQLRTPPSSKPSPPRSASSPPRLRRGRWPPRTLLPSPVAPASVCWCFHWMWWKGVAWSLVSFCICSRGRSPLSSCHQQSKARVPDRCRIPKKDAHKSGYVLQRDIQKLQALLRSRGLGEWRTDGGSSSLSEVLAGPPLAASRPRPDSDRANDTSLAEWMDEDSFISMMTGRCSFSFHPSVDTWKKQLLRMTTFSAMVEKWFLLVNNDIIMYQCTIKSNCNTNCHWFNLFLLCEICFPIT